MFSEQSNIIEDTRSRFYLPPTRIVWLDRAGGDIANPEAMLQADESFCRITPGPGDTPPAIVLDFGQELNGGVCIEVINTSPGLHARVRLRFGESVAEVMGQPDKDHAFHEFTLEFPCRCKEEIGHTGFRFVRLDLLDPHNSIAIRQVQAVALERKLPYRGHFESSDPLLNQIWKTGARTVHLCCQDYILDGIKRDRLVWMGDIHPQLHVIASVFGNLDIVPESLNLLRDQTPPDRWMNDISSYSLWWIISVWDWYEYTGNMDFLRSQANYLNALVCRLIDRIDPVRGECLDETRFLDWATAGNDQAIHEGLTALLAWAIKSAGSIFNTINDSGMEEKCRWAFRVLKSIPTAPTDLKQILALQLLAGLADPSKRNETRLARNPLTGLSTWFAYYVLQARAMMGDFTGSLDLIRSFWGGMLSLGATTFWEHFDEDWIKDAGRIDELTPPGKRNVHADFGGHCFQGLRHSLCHGWAGGPTAWLSRHVLGIYPLAPGFTKIGICPHLGDLTAVRGTVPTVWGPITLEHHRNSDGTITTQYDSPKEIDVIDEAQKPNKQGHYTLPSPYYNKIVPMTDIKGHCSPEKSILGT